MEIGILAKNFNDLDAPEHMKAAKSSLNLEVYLTQKPIF
jgi:hypothetical protein